MLVKNFLFNHSLDIFSICSINCSNINILTIWLMFTEYDNMKYPYLKSLLLFFNICYSFLVLNSINFLFCKYEMIKFVRWDNGHLRTERDLSLIFKKMHYRIFFHIIYRLFTRVFKIRAIHFSDILTNGSDLITKDLCHLNIPRLNSIGHDSKQSRCPLLMSKKNSKTTSCWMTA